MKARYFLSSMVAFAASAAAVFGQGTVVVNDPTKTAAETKLSKTDETVFSRDALPRVRKQIASDVCTESVEVAGVVNGAFTKAGAKQTLLFYQFCQTGNGLGWVGLVLIEDGKISGNYISDGGWSADIGVVPDINQNGLSEFTLAYSGGMHQGQGGIGVDIMEFSNGLPKGIGWYKAEEYADTQATTVWKLTAHPGKTPIFYRQKYFSGEGEKWRRFGSNLAFKLGKAYSKFEAVK